MRSFTQAVVGVVAFAVVFMGSVMSLVAQTLTRDSCWVQVHVTPFLRFSTFSCHRLGLGSAHGHREGTRDSQLEVSRSGALAEYEIRGT